MGDFSDKVIIGNTGKPDVCKDVWEKMIGVTG